MRRNHSLVAKCKRRPGHFTDLAYGFQSLFPDGAATADRRWPELFGVQRQAAVRIGAYVAREPAPDRETATLGAAA